MSQKKTQNCYCNGEVEVRKTVQTEFVICTTVVRMKNGTKKSHIKVEVKFDVPSYLFNMLLTTS